MTQDLDSSAVEHLRSVGGQALVEQIVGMFLGNAPKRLQIIREGIEKEAWYNAERSAHSMRSAAGNLGLRTLQELSGRLEEACEAHQTQVAQALLADFVTAWEQVRTRVEQLVLPPP